MKSMISCFLFWSSHMVVSHPRTVMETKSTRRRSRNTRPPDPPEQNRCRKRKGKEGLSNADRLRICEMYLEQEKLIHIADHFEVNKSTISRIVKRFLDTDSHKSKPKGGRVVHRKLQSDQLKVLAEFYHKTKPTLREVREFCEERFQIQLSLGTAYNTSRKIKGMSGDADEFIVTDESELINQREDLLH